MERILNLIRKHCCCCLNCGSLFPESGCLCQGCEQALQLWSSKEIRKDASGMQIQSLYDWSPGQSDLLSHLILWLKGPRQRQAWKYYAQRMAQRHWRPQEGKVIVVPAPATRPSAHDHASLWGQSLAEALGAEFLPCLRKSGSFSQRGADPGTRSLIELELIENYTEVVGFSTQIQWIFADDIVTTGSTARAARRALGSPVNFQVWALAQRSLSCGASRDLL